MNISNFNPHNNPRDTTIVLILLMQKLRQRKIETKKDKET